MSCASHGRDMPKRFRVAAVNDIPAGTGREFTVGDTIVAVYNIDDHFYAMDGICPHAGGPLGEGLLDGRVVTCPWHGWQFDVTTGQHCLNSRIEQRRFRLVIEGDQVFIELSD